MTPSPAQNLPTRTFRIKCRIPPELSGPAPSNPSYTRTHLISPPLTDAPVTLTKYISHAITTLRTCCSPAGIYMVLRSLSGSLPRRSTRDSFPCQPNSTAAPHKTQPPHTWTPCVTCPSCPSPVSSQRVQMPLEQGLVHVSTEAVLLRKEWRSIFPSFVRFSFGVAV